VTVPPQISNPLFDPTFGVFIAQDSRPEGLSCISPEALSPLQRSLLLIDGTVTKFLEAYLLEPVRVTRLEQSNRVLDQDDQWLQAPAGTDLIDRCVMLCGAESGQLLTYAESTIVTGRLTPSMLRGLAVDTDMGGLGRILLESRLESRRESLWFGQESPRSRLHCQAAKLYDGACLLRTYRIIVSGHPLMVITERFPLLPQSAFPD